MSMIHISTVSSRNSKQLAASHIHLEILSHTAHPHTHRTYTSSTAYTHQQQQHCTSTTHKHPQHTGSSTLTAPGEFKPQALTILLETCSSKSTRSHPQRTHTNIHSPEAQHRHKSETQSKHTNEKLALLHSPRVNQP